MPFAAPTNYNEENDPNKKNQGGVNISGQSSSFDTNVPGQDASSGGKQQGSGQYTNIQSYLDANKQQGDQMGQKITDDVSGQAEDASTKIKGLEQAAPTVEAYDPNEAINNVSNLDAAGKAKYKDVKKTGGYTGPSTVDQVSGYQDAQKAASKAATNVANAGNETGQQQLLKSAYERPQYSAGENRLDQVLLQNSAGSKSNLENLSTKYANLDGLFNTTATNLGSSLNAANAQALANREAFIPAETNAAKAVIDPITGRLTQAKTDATNLQNTIRDDIADDKLSEQTLAMLGITDGTKLWNTKLNDYVTNDQSELNENMIATGDERAKYNALMSLFEKDPTVLTSQDPGYKAVKFNNDQFGKDLSAQESAFNDYAANKNVSATSGKFGDLGWDQKFDPLWVQATAQSNLKSAVGGGGPAISYQFPGSGGPAEGYAPTAAQATQRYQALLAQILNEQNYNRKVTKG